MNRQAFVNPVDVVSICRVALDFRAWATPNNRWQSSNGLVGHIPLGDSAIAWISGYIERMAKPLRSVKD